jgi:hypothetical protein
MALGSHRITNDDTMWQRVILSLVCALNCYVLLEAETPLKAWLYHQTQASHVVSLDRVEAGDGR